MKRTKRHWFLIAAPVCAAGLMCLVMSPQFTRNFINAQPAGGKSVDPNANFKDELPRIKPRSPSESLKAFQLSPGFRMELAAVEPLVTDPVAAAFDERGRMYVVCMRGYSEDPGDFLGEVRRLEDTNGDGKFDKSTVFVDKLSWPTAIACWDGGVFIGVAPDILYCRDNDGDGVADLREKAYTGFGRGNVQGLLNSFRWGLDNRIHGATSSSGGNVRRADKNVKGKPAAVALRGRDFAFDPRTRKLAPTSGGAQHGMSFDDWGRKFVCSNSSHIQMVMIEDRYLGRNKHLAAPAARKMIAVDGGQAEVFRQSPVEPWRIVRTRLRVAGTVRGPVEGGGRAAGYFTGSTGVTIYRGNAWPKEHRGLAFIGDVGSNIVHRKRLEPDSIGFRAVRVDKKAEFLTSKEIWFRPVQFANAPDGTLYVLDMYREVIEHPKSLPPTIKKHLDLTSGRNRGRIYRIAPDGFRSPPPPRLDEANVEQLVATLAHDNAWHRETAARLLFQRQDRAAVGPLTNLASQANPRGRMHALYALHGLNALTVGVLLKALADEHPRVREHAVRLAEAPAGKSGPLRSALPALAADKDLRVRYQLACTLGEFTAPGRNRALAEIAKRDAGDAWVRLAVLSSLATGAGEVFAHLSSDTPFRRAAAGGAMLGDLASQIGAQNRQEDLASVLKVLPSLSTEDGGLAATLVQRLSQGLGKSGNPLRKTLAAADPPAARLLDELLRQARQTASDKKQSPVARSQAIRTLALGSWNDEQKLLAALLDNRQPQQVQLAALSSLSRFAEPAVGALVLERFAGFSPEVRAQATDVLFARGERLHALLDALEQKRVRPTNLDPARIKLLRAHPSKPIRERAASLLADVKLARRQDVVQAYTDSLNLKGDLVRGKKLFAKNCSKCHKVENVGHEMAPNLAAMKNRGRESILLNVLDPNREVNPAFVNYILQTEDGRTTTGIIAAETAAGVTLKREEGKTETILRTNIAVLQSTGLSIMPEGLEKELDKQGMADLIAYLMSAK